MVPDAPFPTLTHVFVYEELAAVCRQHGVELVEAMRGLTGIINIGKGALTSSYCKDAPFSWPEQAYAHAPRRLRGRYAVHLNQEDSHAPLLHHHSRLQQARFIR